MAKTDVLPAVVSQQFGLATDEGLTGGSVALKPVHKPGSHIAVTLVKHTAMVYSFAPRDGSRGTTVEQAEIFFQRGKRGNNAAVQDSVTGYGEIGDLDSVDIVVPLETVGQGPAGTTGSVDSLEV